MLHRLAMIWHRAMHRAWIEHIFPFESVITIYNVQCLENAMFSRIDDHWLAKLLKHLSAKNFVSHLVSWKIREKVLPVVQCQNEFCPIQMLYQTYFFNLKLTEQMTLGAIWAEFMYLIKSSLLVWTVWKHFIEIIF